jgi:hypothetical protein
MQLVTATSATQAPIIPTYQMSVIPAIKPIIQQPKTQTIRLPILIPIVPNAIQPYQDGNPQISLNMMRFISPFTQENTEANGITVPIAIWTQAIIPLLPVLIAMTTTRQT